MKNCSYCRECLPLWSFDPCVGTSDGYQYRCKNCIRRLWEDAAKRQTQAITKLKEDPGRFDAAIRNWLYSNAKKRAKKLGVEFTITRDDIPLVHTCPILNIPLNKNIGRQNDDSYSLDRVDNNRGYIPGNVRVISWRANFIKNNLSQQQAEKLLAYIKKEI